MYVLYAAFLFWPSIRIIGPVTIKYAAFWGSIPHLNHLTGFIQASLSKIQGLFKDFISLSKNFQGLKVDEKY